MSTTDRRDTPRQDGGGTDFLDAPDELVRHEVIGELVERYGAGEVCDLGCGAGHLLQWLHPRFVTRYVAVDTSAGALARVGASAIPVETRCCRIQDFVPEHRPIGALVCSEVLYFIDDPGAALVRIADAVPSVGALIVSLVTGGPDKPNWTRGAVTVTRSIDAAGWRRIDSQHIAARSSGIGWDIAVYLPPSKAAPGRD